MAAKQKSKKSAPNQNTKHPFPLARERRLVPKVETMGNALIMEWPHDRDYSSSAGFRNVLQLSGQLYGTADQGDKAPRSRFKHIEGAIYKVADTEGQNRFVDANSGHYIERLVIEVNTLPDLLDSEAYDDFVANQIEWMEGMEDVARLLTLPKFGYEQVRIHDNVQNTDSVLEVFWTDVEMTSGYVIEINMNGNGEAISTQWGTIKATAFEYTSEGLRVFY